MDPTHLKSLLIQESQEFRSLQGRHLALDTRLEEIRDKGWQDENEDLETRDIKKHKLRLKDRMERIARDWAKGRGSLPG